MTMLATMLDVKFTSSSMEEKQSFAFLAACCRFRKSKFHLGHWIEVSDHLRKFFQEHCAAVLQILHFIPLTY